MLNILQGDQLSVPITITLGQQALTAADVEAVRVTMGRIVKSYPGDITFTDGKFLMPLTQGETFSLPPGKISVVVRTKLKNNSIRGSTAFAVVSVVGSPDKELL